MSVFCPECGKRTYDEYKCDHCEYQIKPSISKNTKKVIGIDPYKNKLLIAAVVMIALSSAYIAYSKYKERKMIDDSMEIMFGTSDMKEVANRQKQMYKKLQQQQMETKEKFLDSIGRMRHI